MAVDQEEREATEGPRSSMVTVAPFHKPLTVLHLATDAGAEKTKCRRKMRDSDDLWIEVADVGDTPVCRRCQGLPPLPKGQQDRLFP